MVRMRVLIGVVIYNEVETLSFLLPKFLDLNLKFPFQVLFLNDGSTDGSDKEVLKFISKHVKKFKLLSNKTNKGVGAAIREVIHYGIKNNFDICVIMAGNGKDDPGEIPKLIDPIIKEDDDYIQGSRFLQGGSFKNLPFFRKILIQGFTIMMYLFTGFKCTDATNGFRAYKFSLFKDHRINLNQDWLNRYELETYLHYKVITLGYKIKEVAVSKNYIPGIKRYSKIRPVIDWWKLSRPVFLLKFNIKS